MRRAVFMIVLCALAVSLCGCQTVDGVGQAVQGIGRDICWLSKQRMSFYSAEEDPLYYSEIGGRRVYYRKVDGEYVTVAMQ
ncbi:MAG: hypothetical protein JW828_01615 [Sedimentisphaerales bacterium]|nr:hypothetical protein [Sedimentisphaerales bacterium]